MVLIYSLTQYFPGWFDSSWARQAGKEGIEKKPLEVHRQTSLHIRAAGGVNDDHSPLSDIQLYAPQTTGIQVQSPSLSSHIETVHYWLFISNLISHLAQGYVIPTSYQLYFQCRKKTPQFGTYIIWPIYFFLLIFNDNDEK